MFWPTCSKHFHHINARLLKSTLVLHVQGDRKTTSPLEVPRITDIAVLIDRTLAIHLIIISKAIHIKLKLE